MEFLRLKNLYILVFTYSSKEFSDGLAASANARGWHNVRRTAALFMFQTMRIVKKSCAQYSERIRTTLDIQRVNKI